MEVLRDPLEKIESITSPFLNQLYIKQSAHYSFAISIFIFRMHTLQERISFPNSQSQISSSSHHL